jgi:3-oxoacyl-[acyl-carrier-protein] synthase-1/3-oxoacyl-[acyl-carrier-protein] synthase II
VSEGAAMLLLVASEDVPDNAIAEILGAGLSCDAYHPSGPHPEGAGALDAMKAAIRDAQISLTDIDYINLHGTGTIDNDLSEARALNTLFPDKKPLMSSIKGALGHSLGAAGAVETVVSALTISENLVPANTGCDIPDPELRLSPVMEPLEAANVQTVLSNSFGFGGNNAAVVIGSPKKVRHSVRLKGPSCLAVLGSACLTGAGNMERSLARLSAGRSCKGMVPDSVISEGLSPRVIRRLKRLPRLTLSLATAAHADSGLSDTPSSIFFGTGWGALSETYDFLTKLFESDEQFTSPIDFIGSVHNAPAGQVAIQFGSLGPNITTTGGDYSFEQALMVASLMAKDIDDTMFVIGADESHKVLSGLFDRSIRAVETPSDGGGALCLGRAESSAGLKISPEFYENSGNNPSVISSLIVKLEGQERICERYGAILVGIPGGCRRAGEEQLREFLSLSGYEGPVIDYRRFTGEFASASAVAAVLALRFVDGGELPEGLCGGKTVYMNGKGIVLIGLGDFITAIEVTS